MLSFEDRLDKHFKRIIENTELLLNSKPEEDDHEIIQASFRIMMAPQNEKELAFAESFLSLLVNTASVAKKTQLHKTLIAPIKENKFIGALIEEIKAIDEEERDYDYTPYKDLSIDDAVLLTYDAATISGYSEEEIFKHLCKSLRIGKNDANGKYILADQLGEIQFNINLRPLSNNLNEHMQKVIKLSKTFKEFSDSQEITTVSYDDGLTY